MPIFKTVAVLVASLKSIILSPNSFHMDKTWIKPTWLLRETGNSPLEADTRIPPNKQRKKYDKKYHNILFAIFKLIPMNLNEVLLVIIICLFIFTQPLLFGLSDLTFYKAGKALVQINTCTI